MNEVEHILVVLVFYFVLSFFSKTGEEKNYIEFINVGQGDAIYISYDGFEMLIDGGDHYEIQRYLSSKKRGINTHLNLIQLTHPHSDHLKGLTRLLQNDSKPILTFNDVTYGSKLYEYFLNQSRDYMSLKNFEGDVIKHNNLCLYILWPPEEILQLGLDNINNSSIVTLLDIGEFEILMLGDAELEALESLDLSYIDNVVDGNIEIVKVAHHGSKTGLFKPLYSKFSPDMCVIMVGENNKFGLPDEEVLEFFNEIDCRVFRTDVHGNISLTLP